MIRATLLTAALFLLACTAARAEGGASDGSARQVAPEEQERINAEYRSACERGTFPRGLDADALAVAMSADRKEDATARAAQQMNRSADLIAGRADMNDRWQVKPVPPSTAHVDALRQQRELFMEHCREYLSRRAQRSDAPAASGVAPVAPATR